VVLSADPTGVAPEEIKEIRVEKTIVGGKVVWER
jgi:predicted amidohydrolase YtcJ